MYIVLTMSEVLSGVSHVLIVSVVMEGNRHDFADSLWEETGTSSKQTLKIHTLT